MHEFESFRHPMPDFSGHGTGRRVRGRTRYLAPTSGHDRCNGPHRQSSVPAAAPRPKAVQTDYAPAIESAIEDYTKAWKRLRRGRAA